jgi:hypothetical protein
MMPIHPMIQHYHDKLGQNMDVLFTVHGKKIKDMNKKPNNTTFERKEEF